MFNKASSVVVLIVALLHPIVGKKVQFQFPWDLEEVEGVNSCGFQLQNTGGNWGSNPALLISRTTQTTLQACCSACDANALCARGFYVGTTCYLLQAGSGLTLQAQAQCTYFGLNPNPTTMAPTTTPANNCNCGNTNIHVVYGSPVSITSPNYPSNYPNSCTCTWYLNALPQYNLMMNPLAFITESCCDILTVYSGNGTVNQIERCSGNNTCSNVTSNGPYMTIMFHSDSSIVYSGFNLQISAVQQMPTQSPTLPPQCTCGQSFYSGVSGVVTSPNYPNGYCPNMNCQYIVIVPSGFVQLTFRDFYTLAGDNLTVYDSANIGNNYLIGSYSGVKGGITLYSGGTGASMMFTTTSGSSARGFSIAFQQVNSTGVCGPSVLTKGSGTLSSPNFPYGNYPNNLNCRWTLNVDSNVTGFYNAISFNFAPTSQSENNVDVLTIQNSGGNVIARDSGFNFPAMNISGTGATLTFTTNPTVVYPGFQLTWNAYATNVCACGNANRTILAFGGQQHLYSPNYPSNYCPVEQCIWYLQVPMGYQVELIPQVFSIASGYDTVSFFDGYGTNGRLLQECTGNSCNTIASTGTWMTLVFIADQSYTKQGFDFLFQAV